VIRWRPVKLEMGDGTRTKGRAEHEFNQFPASPQRRGHGRSDFNLSV